MTVAVHKNRIFLFNIVMCLEDVDGIAKSEDPYIQTVVSGWMDG